MSQKLTAKFSFFEGTGKVLTLIPTAFKMTYSPRGGADSAPPTSYLLLATKVKVLAS